jgi:hypothetical protein
MSKASESGLSPILPNHLAVSRRITVFELELGDSSPFWDNHGTSDGAFRIVQRGFAVSNGDYDGSVGRQFRTVHAIRIDDAGRAIMSVAIRALVVTHELVSLEDGLIFDFLRGRCTYCAQLRLVFGILVIRNFKSD